jgi:hypothetical protein
VEVDTIVEADTIRACAMPPWLRPPGACSRASAPPSTQTLPRCARITLSRSVAAALNSNFARLGADYFELERRRYPQLKLCRAIRGLL